MPAALADFCRRTGQPAPDDAGADGALRLESLALRYRWVLERLEELTGQAAGGRSTSSAAAVRTMLLSQFTADACNRPVLAGPVEATAIGNVLVQAIGLGVLGSLAEAREVVRRSFEVRRSSRRTRTPGVNRMSASGAASAPSEAFRYIKNTALTAPARIGFALLPVFSSWRPWRLGGGCFLFFHKLLIDSRRNSVYL